MIRPKYIFFILEVGSDLQNYVILCMGVVKLYNNVTYINSKDVFSDLKNNLVNFIFRSLM